MSFLSPLDLLSVSSNEQDVIRCLSRRPDLTMHEIEKFTKIPLEELERLLNRMVQNARLIRDGEDKFQVSYGKSGSSNQTQTGNGLLDGLFG